MSAPRACLFCRKSKDEVAFLFQGPAPDLALICDECCQFAAETMRSIYMDPIQRFHSGKWHAIEYIDREARP